MAKASPSEITNTDPSKGATGVGDSADMDKNVQQHKFSGKTCEIRLYKGAPDEPKQQFFGVNHYHITITRDKWVTVPVEMADHIESIKALVREQDPAHPDDPDRFVFVDRERFPLQRRD